MISWRTQPSTALRDQGIQGRNCLPVIYHKDHLISLLPEFSNSNTNVFNMLPFQPLFVCFPVSHALILNDSKEEIETNKICILWNACLTIVEVLPSAFPHLLSLFIAIPYCVMYNLDHMLLEVRNCQILFVCTPVYTPMALQK